MIVMVRSCWAANDQAATLWEPRELKRRTMPLCVKLRVLDSPALKHTSKQCPVIQPGTTKKEVFAIKDFVL